MTEKKEEKKVLPITPEQSEEINKIVQKFGETLVRLSQRDKKADGGLIDKALYYPDNYNNTLMSFRRRFEEGGLIAEFPDNEEDQIRYFISVLSPPHNSMEQYYLEQLEQDLARLVKTRAK